MGDQADWDGVMNIEIDWQEPFLIAKRGNIERDHDDEFAEVAKVAGVYFFARWWGETCQPFYIGRGENIHRRLKQHLQSRKIADALRGRLDGDDYIKTGERYFHYGYLRLKTSQDMKICLSISDTNGIFRIWPRTSKYQT
jgi:hypothetical protein